MPTLLSKEKVTDIEAALAEGALQFVVARQFNIATSTVERISSGRHFHQQTNEEQQRRKALGSNSKIPYLPTPEEIHQACVKIRAARRDDDNPAGWMPPVVTDRMMGLA